MGRNLFCWITHVAGVGDKAHFFGDREIKIPLHGDFFYRHRNSRYRHLLTIYRNLIIHLESVIFFNE